ncbi:MAG: hypothetical protein LAO03_23635 [Acidobacteriia bacterium]|nr:hypothetical protein [Terriglobia bacterium]
MAFVRKKNIKGTVQHYLVQNKRVRDKKTGKSKVKQEVLAYLGKYDSVEDAWMNATGKRRRKLERYRKPEDRANDAAMEQLARDYQRKMRELSKQEVEAMLPHLHHPKKDRVQWTPWPPEDPLPF